MKVGKIKNEDRNKYNKSKLLNNKQDSKYKVLVLFILIIIIGAIGFYFYTNSKDNKDKSTQLKTSTEIINDLANVIFLNNDEVVKVALIQNADELKKANPDFYKNAQNGDYYVVLPETSRVLIYRETENKVINFSTFTLNISPIDESLIPESEKPLSIEIRYATNITEAELNLIKSDILTKSDLYNVIATNQSTNDIPSGLSLVLLNYENKPNLIQNFIADTKINAISQKLPSEEPSSSADLIIFVSK
jgi:hypothetical protein